MLKHVLRGQQFDDINELPTDGQSAISLPKEGYTNALMPLLPGWRDAKKCISFGGEYFEND